MYESACTKLRLSRERPLILSRSAQTTQLMRKEGAKTSTQRWRRAPPRSPDRVLSDDDAADRFDPPLAFRLGLRRFWERSEPPESLAFRNGRRRFDVVRSALRPLPARSSNSFSKPGNCLRPMGEPRTRSVSRTQAASSRVTRVQALPLSSERPVRPIRWV